MKLSLEENTNSYQIQRVDDDNVTVNNKVYSQNIIIMSHQIVTWDVANFEDLQIQHFQQLCDLQPELVLLGTGNASRFPSPELLVPLFNAKIGLEVMNITAACHTYTLLTIEGRNVATALIF
ncbi:Mth938-like domain-containing protein [Candidatus Halobeggiatoa sp. HSG11]|nr:Mth938-like domain-containing protein [Candidatus Halobeggiatoa sp. HSG11]